MSVSRNVTLHITMKEFYIAHSSVSIAQGQGHSLGSKVNKPVLHLGGTIALFQHTYDRSR